MNKQNTPLDPSGAAPQSERPPQRKTLPPLLPLVDWEEESAGEDSKGTAELCRSQEQVMQLLNEIKQLRIDLVEAQLQTQFFVTQLGDILRQKRPSEDLAKEDDGPPSPHDPALVKLGRSFLLAPFLFWAGGVCAQWLQRLAGSGSVLLAGSGCLVMGGVLVLIGKPMGSIAAALLDSLMKEDCEGDEGPGGDEETASSTIFGEYRRPHDGRSQPDQKGEPRHE